jgi:vacuolar-type H+-ATPase subunit F/Vma7
MKGKVAIVGEYHLTEGFALAGLKHVFQPRLEEVEQLLERLINEQFSVIFLTPRYYKALSPQFRRRLTSLSHPLVVVLPDGSQSVSEEELRLMIKKALGIDVLGMKR